MTSHAVLRRLMRTSVAPLSKQKNKRFLHIYPSSEGGQGEWNESYAKNSGVIGC